MTEPTQQEVAIAYYRVSTYEQAQSGLGLGAQRLACKREIEMRDWILAGEFTDSGSGKNMTRKGMADALAMLKRGEATVLVASAVDRISRSVLDCASLLQLAHEQGWRLVTLDAKIDTTTPAGEMLLNILSAYAQFERRLISKRTKDALNEYRAKCAKANVKPFRPYVFNDPVIIAQMKSWRKGSNSYRLIAQKLNAQGTPSPMGGKWSMESVRKVLKRPKYNPTPPKEKR